MIIPVRCFSCGSVVGDLHKKFEEEVRKGKNPKEVLDEMGVKRYCCRRMLLTHVEVIDDLMKFSI
ncbi:MAG: DNA-directed RNA polymerase subunit N [Candidatus Diapherotrites archaeon]|nr:DNA-directed RNA polymerase subunit N [Candidatus Diapherotrites archaeon]